MAKTTKRAYSRYTREAIELFAVMIREARLERKLPAQELAERAGISRGLLQRIEKGDPSCAISAVFEVAYLLGIRLFDCDEGALTSTLVKSKEKLALLPKAARKSVRVVDDDF
ncbi:helix-turn-helix transcriptional regulator [Candidatus Berkiella cookevillensis]|uniref:Helix-turn-helix protein n=1 Tax=Candidatus Berkiella cookevillensis TaxID=437022 RepID=A0A0Q9YN30_9GAMM|nr:helix-turn-helix transcriptional regulator [Candidatus Berkiella cookevillensis]MCS5709791.1 helix-turn-helix transcriptional regulator [Candidatus Berkiella cookevillensis]